jgi:hypothetical protein
MEFKDGYPKPNGASDFDDSSHLAGILVLTDHPQAPDMRQYVSGNKYIRNPWTKVDCSRDQGILIMCGLLKQGHKDLVRTDFINGKDILLPSVHGIETIAKTGKPTWLQRQCLIAELKFDGESIEEPFQNMAKAWAYGELRLWTEINKIWDVAILNYLRGGRNKWRNEPELAEYIIQKIESLTKT